MIVQTQIKNPRVGFRMFFQDILVQKITIFYFYCFSIKKFLEKFPKWVRFAPLPLHPTLFC